MGQGKVLVTGGAGFIGSHVVDGLIEAGYDVAIVDDLSTGHRRNLNPKARFYEISICDPGLAQVFEQERPDYVDHHAAQMNVRRSIIDPEYDARVNILGSLNLIQCAVKYGVKNFVYISSGGAAYGEPEYLPCDEAHPINPICQYGVTKHTVEHYLFLYGRNYGLNYAVLRYPNVYGPRQDPYGEAGVVAIFTRQMQHGQQVYINGSGEQVRDFVYVSDCARANVMLIEDGGREIFNLGCGVGTSVNEIYQHLKEINQYPLEARHNPAIVGETFRIYLDASKARRMLNWEPTVGLREGLERTAAYFREHDQEPGRGD